MDNQLEFCENSAPKNIIDGHYFLHTCGAYASINCGKEIKKL